MKKAYRIILETHYDFETLWLLSVFISVVNGHPFELNRFLEMNLGH
jgi:hypothetical protein